MVDVTLIVSSLNISTLVPSTYNDIEEDEFSKWGANVVIYANHMLRASYLAMNQVAESILKNSRSANIEKKISSIKDLLKYSL